MATAHENIEDREEKLVFRDAELRTREAKCKRLEEEVTIKENEVKASHSRWLSTTEELVRTRLRLSDKETELTR